MRIVSICFLGLLILTLSSCDKKNTLTLRFDPNVDQQDVEIWLEIPPDTPLTQIFDGVQQFNIPGEYGENDWYFSYRKLKGYIRHFKTNRRNTHDYTFHFKELDGQYFVDIDIKGSNELKRTIEMK